MKKESIRFIKDKKSLVYKNRIIELNRTSINYIFKNLKALPYYYVWDYAKNISPTSSKCKHVAKKLEFESGMGIDENTLILAYVEYFPNVDWYVASFEILDRFSELYAQLQHIYDEQPVRGGNFDVVLHLLTNSHYQKMLFTQLFEKFKEYTNEQTTKELKKYNLTDHEIKIGTQQAVNRCTAPYILSDFKILIPKKYKIDFVEKFITEVLGYEINEKKY